MIPEKRAYGIMVFADDTVIYNENRQQVSEVLLWGEEKSDSGLEIIISS